MELMLNTLQTSWPVPQERIRPRQLLVFVLLSAAATAAPLSSTAAPTGKSTTPASNSLDERLTPGYTHVEKIHAGQELHLQEVVDSTEKHYPSILAAQAEMFSAKGVRLSQDGQFDLNLKASHLAKPEGKDQNRRWEAMAELPTTLWGTNFFVGYRGSNGQFPTYDGEFDRYNDGAYRAGLEVPLLQNGPIDKRRTNLATSEAQLRQAEQRLGFTEVDVLRQAKRKYWEWVASGLRLETIQELVRIAEERDRQLERRFRAGDLPEIEWRDNQRAIWQRRSQLVTSERIFRRVALELSLYYRNSDGEPVLADSPRVPRSLPEPKPRALQEAELVQEALRARPDLAELDQQLREIQAELRLSDNQLLPKLDFKFAVERDVMFRNGNPASGASLGVAFELPLQRRLAKGKVEQYSAKRTAIEAKRQLLSETVRIQVRDALIALRATAENAKNIREEAQLAKKVERGERLRFQNGDSNLLAVNLREQATADALVREIDALAQYQQTRADLEAALGQKRSGQEF